MAMVRTPPLFSWKGMQLWAIGSRAPGLCRLLIRTKTPAKVRIARFFRKHRARDSSIRRFHHSRKEEARVSSALSACCVSNCVAETSDSLQHPLAMEASSSGYERMKGKEEVLHAVEHVIKLGSSSHGSSRSSSASQSDSSASTSKLIGSPATALSSKLKGTCTRIVSAAQQNGPRINELIVGNQFLTHVTAAPVASGPSVELNPSAGLVNGPQKPRDADLKDRIIFFQ